MDNTEAAAALRAAPEGGLYRVGRWPDPFSPPPIPSPLPVQGEPVYDGNRFDDATGTFNTLYCASTAEGAYGETIARFRLSPGLMERMDQFLDGEPDEGEPKLYPGEIPEDYFTQRLIGHLEVDGRARFVDTTEANTVDFLTESLPGLLACKSLSKFGSDSLLSPDRSFTRPIATYLHDYFLADPEHGVVGLTYQSTLHKTWECWAIWELASLLTWGETAQPITRDNPELQAAAKLLGVSVAGYSLGYLGD